MLSLITAEEPEFESGLLLMRFNMAYRAKQARLIMMPLNRWQLNVSHN